MNKTWIIIQREYLTRVKKKSFLILTFLMPVLMGAMMVLPAWLANRDSTDTKQVAVADYSGMIADQLNNNEAVLYTAIKPEQEQEYKDKLDEKGFFALLVIPEDVSSTSQVSVFGNKQVNIDVKNNINWQVRQIIEKEKLTAIYAEANIPDLEKRLEETKTHIKVKTYILGKEAESTEEGSKEQAQASSTEAAMGIAYASGFIIYMFIFMYGGMVMRGVVEEKQNRVVEVIISSVKPIQLMMGKIIGIVAVGLTQVGIWILLLSIVASSLPSSEILSSVLSVEMGPVLFGFVAYFILGYLLYSSLMAAVAAAV
ncbi:MAG: ABC transporter permease, partial [Bacteroidales bacterium]|nr:ABC transporter permease [Bacteroidales bacterium]